jgi:CBS domain-containing protein
MLARDVMTAKVATVAPTLPVEDCARLLLEKHISAAPVVDEKGTVLGIVSEGDLMRRIETHTEKRHSWWLELVSDPAAMARDFVKSTGKRVTDVMTKQVVSVTEETSLGEIADILDKRRIKRVPVVKDGKLVGIVSRADLVRAMLLGAEQKKGGNGVANDAYIRDQFLARLGREPWGPRSFVNIVVKDGAVELYGFALSTDEVRAIGLLAEGLPGVKSVDNQVHVGEHPKYVF